MSSMGIGQAGLLACWLAGRLGGWAVGRVGRLGGSLIG